ncbi:hypothetical protein [Fibrobacter sp.]|uniref:hypothetical protein n=1 Tax=Fibrobacter sp. TaxID=35828 RepID=UPI0025BEBFE0|nr:hypothetical protein [Fibrobacter sp.]MCI6437990.1 hypothetical protein [Fibrobacter sp.]
MVLQYKGRQDQPLAYDLKQGSMVVKNASSEIKEIFEVTGFCDILTVESSYFVR